jgi:hypothetical protein
MVLPGHQQTLFNEERVLAGLSRDPKSGMYRIQFRFWGKQYNKSLKTTDEKRAQAWKVQIEDTLFDIERGRQVVPPDADLWEFLKTDLRICDKAARRRHF